MTSDEAMAMAASLDERLATVVAGLRKEIGGAEEGTVFAEVLELCNLAEHMPAFTELVAKLTEDEQRVADLEAVILRPGPGNPVPAMENPAFVNRLAEIVEVCSRLELVKWDRLCSLENRVDIYGWMKREDGRSDFVLLQFTDLSDPSLPVGIATSSAEYSAEMTEALYGTTDGHAECERVPAELIALSEVP